MRKAKAALEKENNVLKSSAGDASKAVGALADAKSAAEAASKELASVQEQLAKAKAAAEAATEKLGDSTKACKDAAAGWSRARARAAKLARCAAGPVAGTRPAALLHAFEEVLPCRDVPGACSVTGADAAQQEADSARKDAKAHKSDYDKARADLDAAKAKLDAQVQDAVSKAKELKVPAPARSAWAPGDARAVARSPFMRQPAARTRGRAVCALPRPGCWLGAGAHP